MQTVDNQTSEVETLRKKVNREVSISNGISEPKNLSPKSEASTNREEVAGLKYVVYLLCMFRALNFRRHIVQELQKEHLAATQRIKLLESENQLLSAEAAQLREVGRLRRSPLVFLGV
jgi:hypothetical protein